MFYDDLPIWGFIGKVEKIQKPAGMEKRYHLFTHGERPKLCNQRRSHQKLSAGGYGRQDCVYAVQKHDLTAGIDLCCSQCAVNGQASPPCMSERIYKHLYSAQLQTRSCGVALSARSAWHHVVSAASAAQPETDLMLPLPAVHFEVLYNGDRIIEINVSTDPTQTVDISADVASKTDGWATSVTFT